MYCMYYGCFLGKNVMIILFDLLSGHPKSAWSRTLGFWGIFFQAVFVIVNFNSISEFTKKTPQHIQRIQV